MLGENLRFFKGKRRISSSRKREKKQIVDRREFLGRPLEEKGGGRSGKKREKLRGKCRAGQNGV